MQTNLLQSADNMLACLKAQVDLACQNKPTKLEDLQTETGVKCLFTQTCIDSLLERAKSLLEQGLTREDATEELRQWVTDNADTIYNPLLQIAGECQLSACLHFLWLHIIQDLTQRKTHHISKIPKFWRSALLVLLADARQTARAPDECNLVISRNHCLWLPIA
jgi:hypothetical protein